jgi:hypothetical protein
MVRSRTQSTEYIFSLVFVDIRNPVLQLDVIPTEMSRMFSATYDDIKYAKSKQNSLVSGPQSSIQQTCLCLHHPETHVSWNSLQYFQKVKQTSSRVLWPRTSLFTCFEFLSLFQQWGTLLLEPPPHFIEGNVLIYSEDDGDLMPTSHHVRNILREGGTFNAGPRGIKPLK